MRNPRFRRGSKDASRSQNDRVVLQSCKDPWPKRPTMAASGRRNPGELTGLRHRPLPDYSRRWPFSNQSIGLIIVKHWGVRQWQLWPTLPGLASFRAAGWSRLKLTMDCARLCVIAGKDLARHSPALNARSLFTLARGICLTWTHLGANR